MGQRYSSNVWDGLSLVVLRGVSVVDIFAKYNGKVSIVGVIPLLFFFTDHERYADIEDENDRKT